MEKRRIKDFVRKVANMTQRTVTDNTTDEAEKNGVAETIRGFIAEARRIEETF